jgi:hypothetical protein
MRINIQIEHIVMDGLSLTETQQAIFRQSVTDRLGVLLVEKPMRKWRQNQGQPVVQPPSIELAGNDPVQLAQELAQAIYAGLTL